MKKREYLLLGALVTAALGFELRTIQLRHGFENGLPVGSAWLLPALLSAAVAVALAIFVFRLPEKQAYAETYRKSRIGVLLYVGASGLLMASSLAALLAAENGSDLLFQRIVAALGILASFSLIASAAAQYRGGKPSAWTGILPVAYLLVEIVFNFRRWSVDPIVLDYCYKLLSSLSAMLGLFYAGGFLFDRGKRRMSLFFCLLGVYFAGVTLADGGLEHCLLTGGLLLLLAAQAQQLQKD